MGHITRLELEDFKSYGGKHVIGPFSRFTAVIGPNGSGKSNLMDAISFVLGVNSRHLRSTQLKDLIHKSPSPNTTDTNPNELKKGAHVTLVYSTENDLPPAKSNEILFGRRISSKGVSSYHYNAEEVSWDTYQNELKSIGVLVKARNFLVFQGDVEAIASKKPEELSKLFEQISFSDEKRKQYDELMVAKVLAEENTIFAYQKKKGLVAEKRLVKEQREEAKEYEAKQGQLNDIKVEHYLWQLFQVSKKIETHKTESKSIEEDLAAFSTKEEAMLSEYKDKKKAHSNRLREVNKTRETLRSLRKKVEKLQPKVIQLEQKRSFCVKQLEEARQNQSKTKAKAVKKEEEISNLQRDLDELKEAQNDFEQQLSRQSGSDKENLVMEGKQLDEYHRIREAVQVRTNILRGKWDSMKRQLSADEQKKELLIQECSDNDNVVSVLTEDLKDVDSKINHLKEDIAEINRAINDIEKKIRQAENEIRNEAKRREQLEKDYDNVNQKLQLLRDEKRQYQADSRKNETIETLQRLYPGVRGRLADLCKPVQRKYNMALTVAIGRHLDALVVNDYKTGQDCIKYLRESRLGTASFIPLDKIRVKPINERFRTLGNNTKLVLDTIEYEPEFEPALLYAVADTVVCDTIESARALCFVKGEKVKAVTLNGMVVNKNGSMTGGRTQRDLSRAGRWDEKEIEELQTRKNEIYDALHALNSHGSSYSTVLTLRVELEELQNRIRYAKAELITTEAKKPSIVSRLSDAQTRNETILKPEIEKYEKATAERQGQIDAMEEEIHTIEDAMFADFSKRLGIPSIRVYEENNVKQHQQKLETKRKLTEHIAKIEAQIAYLRSQKYDESLQQINEKIKHGKEMLEKLTREETELENSLCDVENEKKEQEKALKALTKKVDDLESELQSKAEEKSDVEKKKSEIAKRLTNEETRLEYLYEQQREILRRSNLDQVSLPVNGEEQDRATLSDSAEAEASELGLGENAHIGLNIDFASVKDKSVLIDKTEAYNKANAKFEEQITELQSELERMQPNMRALDKYEEILARIAKEETELERIKQQCHEATTKFEEIKSVRYDRFMEAFNHVSNVIDETYKQLTKSSKHLLGGTAYLSLENTEEPYLNGIKYHAMPPMKRFREMEQLSGGEKTVAALALLFAIHTYRPSPFFILDEVDAALDNVNVNKVSNFIANCGVQCIVISLKDLFYEKADSLVGICKDIATQRSKSLTLDLTQFEEK